MIKIFQVESSLTAFAMTSSCMTSIQPLPLYLGRASPGLPTCACQMTAETQFEKKCPHDALHKKHAGSAAAADSC